MGYGNLDSLPHRIIVKGSYIDSQIEKIPWDTLEDFMQGEQQTNFLASSTNECNGETILEH